MGTPGSRFAHQLLTSLAMENMPFFASLAPPINYNDKPIRSKLLPDPTAKLAKETGMRAPMGAMGCELQESKRRIAGALQVTGNCVSRTIHLGGHVFEVEVVDSCSCKSSGFLSSSLCILERVKVLWVVTSDVMCFGFFGCNRKVR